MVLRRLKHRCAGLTTRTPQALARVLQPGLQHLRGSCCAAASVWAEQLTEDKQRSVPPGAQIPTLAPARLRRVVLATLSRVVASRVVAELRGGPVAD